MPIPLMLATLTDRRDFGDDWLLERKFDGERCVARKDGGDVRLESRTGKDLTGTYPEVRAAVAAQRARASCSTARWSRTTAIRRPSAGSSSASGSPTLPESCWPRSRSSTASSTSSRSTARISPAGRSSSAAPGWRGRSGRGAALQLTEAWRGDSQRRFAEACRSGWEGLIAKRADAPYAPGPVEGLAEAEVRLGAGARHRRLHRSRGQPDRLRCAARRLTTRTAAEVRRKGRHRLHARRRSASSAPGCASWRPQSRRSSTRDRSRAAHTGPGPSWSPRSASPSGRGTVGCASRASSGCATTSAPTRSSASGPGEPRPGPRRAGRERPTGGRPDGPSTQAVERLSRTAVASPRRTAVNRSAISASSSSSNDLMSRRTISLPSVFPGITASRRGMSTAAARSARAASPRQPGFRR